MNLQKIKDKPLFIDFRYPSCTRQRLAISRFSLFLMSDAALSTDSQTSTLGDTVQSDFLRNRKIGKAETRKGIHNI